ncbi:MAG: diacylglycerol kinase family lipid kinase [Actinobacteria bacterium]|nr:diacylglycerol kinase family lipid kinase [Actinomycetota bacterium]
MRGLLVVNPKATATTDRTRDVLIHALADQFDLETVRTDHRGHAMELGARAVVEGLDIVVTLGGDGTVNETVNGIMSARGDRSAAELPALGAVPGGSANVFTRALGFPMDPVEATGELVAAIRDDRTTLVCLAHAEGTRADGENFARWITFNAGLGLDAEIIHSMEAQRAKGKEATPTRYLVTSVRSFFTAVDRKAPAITLDVPADGEIDNVHMAIIQNASPWTYLGTLPVNPLPDVTWENGLGVWAVRRMRFVDGIRYSRRMLMKSRAGSTKHLYVGVDLGSFTAACDPPVALQIDGEGLGEITSAKFTSHPEMLRVYC